MAGRGFTFDESSLDKFRASNRTGCTHRSGRRWDRSWVSGPPLTYFLELPASNASKCSNCFRLGVLRRTFHNLAMTRAVDSPLATANYPLSSPGSATRCPTAPLLTTPNAAQVTPRTRRPDTDPLVPPKIQSPCHCRGAKHGSRRSPISCRFGSRTLWSAQRHGRPTPANRGVRL